MKPNPIPLVAALFLFSLNAFSQKDSGYSLLLKSGSIFPQKNISASFIDQFNRKAQRIDGQTFTIIQFDNIPNESERQKLLQSGIELLDYIPNNAYTACIRTSLDANILMQLKARAIVELIPQQKMFSKLAQQIFPAWSVKIPGTIDVWISFPRTIPFETINEQLKQRNFDIISTQYKNYHVIELRIAQQRLNELASLPFVEYVEPTLPEPQPLLNNFTNWGKDAVKGSILNAPLSVGGRNLKGDGVVIGVGDNANTHLHVDFTNRIIDRAATNWQGHGTHVTGIVGGAGIVNEIRTGFAPKSRIISQVFSGIFDNAPSYVSDYGMVVTNNSYGNITDDCDYFGVYDIYSRILDQQALDLPNLQTVFAAGNSGYYACTPYPDSFKTVLGSYQSAKNVICVGNAAPFNALFSQSSRGPVKDGRIKPEIISIGSFIISDGSPGLFPYYENTGTSMASPAVSGGVGLLYQRYRQLHSGANPKNALIKTLVCNSGDDWGNAGPDYKHGFGLMNLWRAVNMMENNRHFNSSIATGTTQANIITVPAGLAQLKVMLYWNDPVPSPLANQTLVNDLDLEVMNPSSSTILPLILDTIPQNIKNTATNGADHINNIEQVVINNPVAGNYTIRVKGTAVTQNSPQEYFVAYDLVPVETKLAIPIGGEGYVQGENLMIQWDSYGDPANTFKTEFSSDNGTTWSLIKDNINPGLRFDSSFIVPNISTDQALIRVTRNGTGFTSTSYPFTIMTLPTVTLAPVQCEGYISINWTAVAGATDYEVMMLRGDEMVPVATTTVLNYTFSGLSKDSVYWVTVRPGINGHPGRRAIAISRQPNSGTCAGNISDNDLKVDAVVAPVSGRQFTSTSLAANTVVSVRIKNLDDAAVNVFDVKYSVNGGPFITETVNTPIVAGATYIHNFAATYDFSTSGIYVLKAVVKNTSAVDAVVLNDTMTVVIKQLPNTPLNILIGVDFIDNIETGTDTTYYGRQIGLTGLDRYDFVPSTLYGRIRPFVNTGIANSGTKAMTLDMDQYNPSGNADSLTATFNLSNYNAATDDIRLDFYYKNHGQLTNAANKVWIRGDDQKSWIQLYDLFANQNEPGSYKKTISLELTNALIANAQNFSSSFQARWGQWGQILAADNNGGAGYSFDDIHLYKVSNDMQMISIDTPIVNSCALSATTLVKVTVRNSTNTTITNLPVKFRVDAGAITSETISSVAAGSTVQYTFNGTANLSSIGSHTMQVWVDYAADTYRLNDTATKTIINAPLINSFPYLENFESGVANWYSNGKKNSWTYGTPSSSKINSAANGSKAWKTNLTGSYNDNELSYLYSPCFDISGMSNPTLSLSIALDLEDCGGSLCDGAWVEYSSDGISWTRLGSFGSGTNWYNKNYGGGTNPLWSIQNYTRWHVATTLLPAGISKLRLRFVISSDQGVSREGVAIDDIHIYNNTNGIYDGLTLTSPITQTVSGSSWINFISGNKLMASVNPNNQNLGNTDVKVYIDTAASRYTATQYYHKRNITIVPSNNLADSATVRFYFLDNETEALINATGCASCSKPKSAYELGVSKYSDPALRSSENGTLIDDAQGIWSFINSSQAVKVPFDKGYYTEFKVADFSEFWLNNGGTSRSSALPLKFILFTATKQSNKDVLLDWKTIGETNVNRYEVEVARSTVDLQANNWSKIGQVASQGNSSGQQSYSFTDMEINKYDVRYYRLRVVENDGSFHYSQIRSVAFNSNVDWQVFPNPSTGIFYLYFQQNQGEALNINVYDMAGKLVKQIQTVATGFVQKFTIDLHQSKYATGLYMIIVEGIKKEVFKVLKK
jgi:hypothetical protein